MGSVAARRAVQGAQTEAIEKLLDRALLDPDLPLNCSKTANPAPRLSWPGGVSWRNGASHLADMPDGEQKDLVKDAISK